MDNNNNNNNNNNSYNYVCVLTSTKLLNKIIRKYSAFLVTQTPLVWRLFG